MIDGGDGADKIAGGLGDDQIAADDNPRSTRDVVNGDGGNDTMTWNPGDDDDVNEGGEGNDTVVVNGATGDEDFQGQAVGDCRPRPVRPDEPRAVQHRHRDQREPGRARGAGNDEIKGSKGLAGLIDSTFSGDDGKDQIKGPTARTPCRAVPAVT